MQSAGRSRRGTKLWPALLVALGGCSRPSEPSGPPSASAEPPAPGPLVEVTTPPQQEARRKSQLDPAPPPAEVADVCAELRRQGAYVSREDFECGPPFEGRPAPRCHSRIEFSEGTYQWRHTDMVFTGTYTCEGVRIQGDDHRGTYNPDTGHLRWEGVEYAPEAKR